MFHTHGYDCFMIYLIKIYSFLETYISKVGMAMLVYCMIWYGIVSGVLSGVCPSIHYVMVWI